MFTVKCNNCKYAFKMGAEVDPAICEQCPYFIGVQMTELAYLEAQQDQPDGPNDHEWAEFEAFCADYHAERQAAQDEQRTTGQAGYSRKPERARRNG